MTSRFILLTFASCIALFAAIWAATAPKPPSAAPAAAALPPALYADCDAVRAAGAAPLRAGQPGYRPALDPNMNGIACEAVGTPNGAPVSDSAPSTAPDSLPAAPPAMDAPSHAEPAPSSPQPSPAEALPPLT